MSSDPGRYAYLPLTQEWSDRNILLQHEGMIEDYAAQVQAAFHSLDDEAKIQGGRVLSLAVTPWLIGYPHRIAGFARLLETILAAGSVWPATGTEILDSFRAQSAR